MMSFARDLLDQAAHLAGREPKKPKQASLRRAISSAYYALFHLLIQDVATSLAPKAPDGLRELIQRALAHADMKNVCKGFVAGNATFINCQARGTQFQSKEIPPATQRLLSLPLDSDLLVVMNAFIEMQEARHTADYDIATTWNRVDVLTKITSVENAFAAWNRVKSSSNATVLKAALALQKHWGR